MALRIRRGLSSSRTSITPVEGEFIYTTDTKQVYVGDGSTPGGLAVGGTATQYLQVANAAAVYQTKAVERAALANTNLYIAKKISVANAKSYMLVSNTKAILANTNSFIKAQLANTNAYIATRVSSVTFNGALANTNAYIASRASWTSLTSTNTALRSLINSRLQVANVVGVYQTVATERATLANTNSRINLLNTNLTGTNTAVRALVNDRLQVTNASATFQTKAVERAALANTNASIASQASRITLVNTNLTSTNTALRILINDRYQIANVNTLLNAKATWSALTSTNTAIRNYVDTKVADLVGTAPATLNTLNELSSALANDASFSATITNLIGTKISVANTKAYLANTNAFIKAQLANTNSYISTKLNTSTFNAALANTNAYIATKLNTTAFNSALANTNAYIASVATNSSDPATRNLVFSTNTALRALISDRLQVTNANATFATKAYSAANSYVKSVLANTNSYIATKLNTSTFNLALANTNSYIATKLATSTFNSALANTNAYIASVAATGGYDKATWSALTSTNTALRTLISDRLQVANAAAVYQTKAVERAALANTNASIATQTSRITLVNTNLTGTNTALRTLISDRYQVANVNTLLATKASWSALAATNTAIRTLVSDRLQVANAAATYQTISIERAALANTNARINLINTNLLSTNTALRALIGAGGGGANGFSGILVGANVVSADSTTDRLTLVAGSGIALAANPSTDTITISTTSGAAANVVTKAVKDLTQNDTVVTSVSGVVVGGSGGITTGKAIAMAIVFGG